MHAHAEALSDRDIRSFMVPGRVGAGWQPHTYKHMQLHTNKYIVVESSVPSGCIVVVAQRSTRSYSLDVVFGEMDHVILTCFCSFTCVAQNVSKYHVR